MLNRILGLQTFELLPDPWAAEIAARGWGRVRVEGTDYARVMDQCQTYDLWPLWILDRHEEYGCPSGIDVEIGNEQNDGCGPKWPRLSPAQYAAWVMDAWPTLRDKGCVVYVGAANNTSVPGLAWTADVLSRLRDEHGQPLYHPNLRVSIHRYPMHDDQKPAMPQKGHATIAAEDAAILACVRGRRWAISEAGLLDVQYRDWGSWRYFGKQRWRRAVDGHRWQAARFRRLGADYYVVYQLQGEYGVRTADGQWKPAADLPSLV
jgi:hypothetical protein